MSAIPPPSMSALPATAHSARVGPLELEAIEPGAVATRRSDPPSTGRWWFAFDRWHVVMEPDDAFVLG